MLFVIAYDIADPRRLRRVARCLERRAVRCQKSVFLYRGSLRSLAALLDRMTPLLDERADCIQAWRLSRHQSPLGAFRGTPLNVFPGGAVASAGQTLLIEQHADFLPVSPDSNGKPTHERQTDAE